MPNLGLESSAKMLSTFSCLRYLTNKTDSAKSKDPKIAIISCEYQYTYTASGFKQTSDKYSVAHTGEPHDGSGEKLVFALLQQFFLPEVKKTQIPSDAHQQSTLELHLPCDIYIHTYT